MKPHSGRALIPILAGFCALSFVAQINWRPAQFALLAEIKTDAPALLQLRYNRGYGVRQEGISTRILAPTRDFVRVRFPIQVNTAQDLRLVNLGFGHSLEIRSLALKPLGRPALDFGADKLSSHTPDTHITQAADKIEVRGSGTEPLVLHIDRDLRVHAPRIARIVPWIFIIPLSAAALALVWALRGQVEGPPHPVLSKAPRWWNSSRCRTVVVGALILGYLVSSLLGLNGSSTALWRYYADREMPTAGLLLGSPKEVRSDEWLIQTPWIFSQALRTPAFSQSNPNVGSGATSLVTNLPVRHWSALFRPQMWPFFLLGPERAFAFYWNFKSFGLLLGALLFFGVLTGGRTLLDLAGAFFLTFSPFIQWWLSTPTCLPEMLAMTFFALWLVAILLRGRTQCQVVSAAGALVIVAQNFIFCCYPRFQIPLAYLAAAVGAGMFVMLKQDDGLARFRLGCIGLALAAAMAITWRWWCDVEGIVQITSLLSYPGQIRFNGGGFEWNRFFDPFLEFSMTGERFPERLENACEAAGFLFIAPLLALRAIRDAVRGRVDWLLLVPLAVAGFTIFYMTVGVPMWLAKASGWVYVSSSRANLVVGVGTSIALIRYLAGSKQEQLAFPMRLGIFVGSFLLLIPLLEMTNSRLGHFESLSVIVATALFLGLATSCIWSRSVSAAAILLIIPQFYACALINPISQGLPGITQSRTLDWLGQNRKNRPDGNWLVLGDTFRAEVFPDLLKATGAEVLGGMRCNPDYSVLRIVDPARKSRDLTDRYAWVHFKKADGNVPAVEAAPDLAYNIRVPLTVDFLDQLNVKHILQVDMPMNDEAVPGFHLVGIQNDCRLLERD